MTVCGCLALAVATGLGSSHTPALDEPRIELMPSDRGYVFAVSDLSASFLVALSEVAPSAWQRVFQVRPESALRGDSPVPAMLGSYRIESERLLFTPRFPIDPGLSYLARFDPTGLGRSAGPGAAIAPPTSARLSLPAPDLAPTTRIEGVYPSGDRLPENLLKFYVQFSAAMSARESYRHVRLLDSDGREVELPFLELPQELWDRDGRRLTLLLDPGRIKRDLVPNREVGPPLRPGETFELAIDASWLDTRGVPLVEGHVKRFEVTEADRRSPDPEHWVVSPPGLEAGATLRVRFDEPLDHALATRLLRVVTADGRGVAGDARTDPGELTWSFDPVESWRAGRYELRIDPALEDLAGNSVGRPFEVHGGSGHASERTATISLGFEVGDPETPASVSQTHP